MLPVRRTASGVRFTVRVQPRASTAGVAGAYGDALRVRVTAPPVGGAANDMLVRTLAEAFGVPPRAVTILSGARARTKVVEVAGVTEADVRRIS